MEEDIEIEIESEFPILTALWTDWDEEVLEFSQVPFMDSRGLETLLDLADRQQESGLTTKVAGVPELCREIFELTGVSQRLDLFDSAESAVRSFL